MKYKLSIIIPFFFSDNEDIDSKRYFSLLAFEKCLKAVFKSQYKKFEVIAVSDGSSNDSVEIAKKYPCKIIKIQKNSGAAFSRNVGAKKAKGQILVFLDSDVEIKSDALKIINGHFNKKKNYGMIQGIYSHVPNYKSYTNEYLQSYYSYYIFTEIKKNKFIKTLVTNIFAIKESIFNNIGGFDANFSGANCEDQEFGFRLQENGHKIPIGRKLNTIHHVNFGVWEFVKKITKIQIGEMKMHLRNKKTFLSKSKQSNYWGVILGLLIIVTIFFLIIVNLFLKIPFYTQIVTVLNLLFLVIHIRFFKFILLSKGLFPALRAIFFTYLHRLVVANCAISGLVDFYIFRNKY